MDTPHWYGQGLKNPEELEKRRAEANYLNTIAAAAANSKKTAFTIAGSLPKDQSQATISFKTTDGSEATLNVPCTPEDPTLNQLIEVMQPAYFGKATERVYDKEYRSALALTPDAFTASFSLDDHPEILDKVKELMMPEATHIEAKLDKLNVYKENDHFKVHKDTPHGDARTFGSLVVCLPVAHKGGGLLIEHRRTRITHDWVEGAGKGELQWAAFYSDCDHSVDVVFDGVRITLNYLLTATTPSEPAATDPSEGKSRAKKEAAKRQGDSALKKALQNALQDPTFMIDGGKLGFPCSHVYPHTAKNARVNMPKLMKGDDAMVLATARELGLESKICRVWRVDVSDDYFNDCGIGMPQPGCVATTQGVQEYEFEFKGLLVDDFQAPWKEKGVLYEEDVMGVKLITKHSKAAHCDPAVRWLGGIANFNDWKAGGAGDVFGNDEASLEEFYVAAAMLLTVPPASQRTTKVAQVVEKQQQKRQREEPAGEEDALRQGEEAA